MGRNGADLRVVAVVLKMLGERGSDDDDVDDIVVDMVFRSSLAAFASQFNLHVVEYTRGLWTTIRYWEQTTKSAGIYEISWTREPHTNVARVYRTFYCVRTFKGGRLKWHHVWVSTLEWRWNGPRAGGTYSYRQVRDVWRM